MRRADDARGRRSALLTVSARIPADEGARIAAGRRPRADYVELAAALDADLMDRRAAELRGGAAGRALGRLLGPDVSLAWSCFAVRRGYEVIVTDGEQVGLPYAILTLFASRRSRPHHVMIVHIMSVRKKAVLFRLLRLRSRVDDAIVYASAQRDALVHRLGVSADRVMLSTFMVDTRFFDPAAVTPNRPTPLVCAAGLELRDYPTMVEAVRDLPVDVVLAAASPWSKRVSGLDGLSLPPNVSVVRLDHAQLRQLYADATVVVLPLQETPFQAGITTLLEAMSMAKPIVCSRTTGQTDTLVDGLTGRYVPAGDAAAMRRAIVELLENPVEAARLGAAARAWVVQNASVERYAAVVAERVRQRCGR